MSANKPESRDTQERRATSGSSHEQSDNEDVELEAGPCEQSMDPTDLKRVRRYVHVYQLQCNICTRLSFMSLITLNCYRGQDGFQSGVC